MTQRAGAPAASREATPVTARTTASAPPPGLMYIADLVPGRVRRGPQGTYALVSDEVKVPNGIT